MIKNGHGNNSLWGRLGVFSKVLLVLGLLILVLVVFSKLYGFVWLKTTISKGDTVVSYIESFHQANDRLPISLQEIGIDENYIIQYEAHTDGSYELWFPINAEQNMYYYSDDSEWTEKWKSFD